MTLVKVLGRYSTDAEAQQKAQELSKAGHKSVAVLPPQGSGADANVYLVGILDRSFFDTLERGNATAKQIQCPVCKKMMPEPSFFKCWNCWTLECIECGQRRLFPEKLPQVHVPAPDGMHNTHNHPENVGTCRQCKQPIGYKSMPMRLRLEMVADDADGQMILMISKYGPIHGDLWLIGIELNELVQNARNISSNLPNILARGQQEWFANLAQLHQTCRRIDWSSDYQIFMLRDIVGHGTPRDEDDKYLINQNVRLQKMARIGGDITNHLIAMLTNEEKGEDFNATIDKILSGMTQDNTFSEKQVQATEYLKNIYAAANNTTNVGVASNCLKAIFRGLYSHWNLPPPEKVLTIETLQEITNPMLEDGDYSAAIPYLESWTQRNPDAYQDLSNLAVCYQYLNQPEKAIEINLKVLAAKPEKIPTRQNLAFCYKLAEEYEKAKQIFEEVLAEIKDSGQAISPELYWGMGDVYGYLGEFDRAYEYMQKAKSAGFENNEVVFWINFIENIVKKYRPIIRENPKDGWNAVNNLGWAAVEKNRHDVAYFIGVFLAIEGQTLNDPAITCYGKDLQASALTMLGGKKNLVKALALFTESLKVSKEYCSEKYYILAKQKLSELELTACVQCGNPLPAKSKFCNKCGRKVPERFP